jgi:hypothetical protein
MHVAGSGNFDRVDSSMLEHLDQWKTYPPKSSFKPGDALGLKGEKIFEQPLIASKPGTHTLPGLAFSYFDPGTHRYETARSAPLKITISPSLADGSLNAPQAPAGAPPSAASPATASSNTGLRPDHVVTEVATSTLAPLYLQPRFLAIPSLLALTIAGGWFGLRRRASDPSDARGGRRRGLSKDIDRVLNDMKTAARAGDAASFFNLARTALEPRSGLEARSDLEAGPGGENDDIRRFLALADEANYAGLRPTPEEFERWMRLMRDTLQRDPLQRDQISRALS